MKKILVNEKLAIVFLFFNKDKKLSGFNIYNPIHRFSSKIFNGINSDNDDLVNEIKEYLITIGINISDFNQNPQFEVGEILSVEKHKQADTLNVCKVKIKNETLQIVCGGVNVKKGINVVVAKNGTIMPNLNIIKPANLRGVDSNGMICSASELGLVDNLPEKNIMVLNKKIFKTGECFWKIYYK